MINFYIIPQRHKEHKDFLVNFVTLWENILHHLFHFTTEYTNFARILYSREVSCKVSTNFLINYKMITTDQLREVLEREQALRGYL